MSTEPILFSSMPFFGLGFEVFKLGLFLSASVQVQEILIKICQKKFGTLRNKNTFEAERL